MITRKQYLKKEYTHQEYYGQFGKSLINLVSSVIGKENILNSQDEHFNDIPLRHWDALHGAILNSHVGRQIAKANGYGVSLSDTVCAAKAAAQIIRDSQ